MSGVIQPGATIGVLGSGQLGRMFAIAARRMGYRVHTLSPEYDTPTGQIADLEVQAAYDDVDAVSRFAREVDVVTFEFENVPAVTAEVAARFAPVRPGGEVLHITQHRLREKTFLSKAGFPVTPFVPVTSLAQLSHEFERLNSPAVLKTAGWGYDGKGQTRLDAKADLAAAWNAIQTDEAVLESFIDFDAEVSVVAARGADGNFAHYGLIQNAHRHHILDVSFAPVTAPWRANLLAEAVEITRGVLEKLQVVGVLCVEFFVTRDEQLLINELAPRPHNSGHLTFDACVTSQFEQQLRAICNLPLGSTELLRPAAMANLLGDLWQAGEPRWAQCCSFPEVKLHLYGKAQPRPGRKMGHLTALAQSAEEAVRLVTESRSRLQPQFAVARGQ